MSMLKGLGRSIGLATVQGLCSRHGAALVLAGTVALAGSASLYLGQHSTQTASRLPTAQVGQCGPEEIGYLPETNQFYCVLKSTQAALRIPAVPVRQAMSCGPEGSGYTPEYRFYCAPTHR